MLDVFWEAHDPAYRSLTRQYRAAIFWSNGEQRRLAEDSRLLLEHRSAHEVTTAIEPLGRFTAAEDYHQKYYLRSSTEIATAFHRIYPNERDFAASTAVARVNGFLGGHGGPVLLAEEIESLGLIGTARATLETIVRERNPSESCATSLKP